MPWLLVAVTLAAGYLLGWIRSRRNRQVIVAEWRMASFIAGLALMWVCVASAIGAYSMSVFWMHMVLHLLLIMVVPVLLVLGHPFTVISRAGTDAWRRHAELVLKSRPAGVLTHPLISVALYSVVIIYTHLTGFMDQMAAHDWLMTAEQVAYVVAGFFFLLPLLGEEPIRRRAPYLARLMVLVVAMVPDTLVGVVLLQSRSVPYPMMMSMHPSWAPNHLDDVHAAGGLMWAGGDGLMMAIAIGLMISVVTSPSRRDNMTGAWLESVRAAAMNDHVGGVGGAATITDPDSDQAHMAYNTMLRRLSGPRQ